MSSRAYSIDKLENILNSCNILISKYFSRNGRYVLLEVVDSDRGARFFIYIPPHTIQSKNKDNEFTISKIDENDISTRNFDTRDDISIEKLDTDLIQDFDTQKLSLKDMSFEHSPRSSVQKSDDFFDTFVKKRAKSEELLEKIDINFDDEKKELLNIDDEIQTPKIHNTSNTPVIQHTKSLDLNIDSIKPDKDITLVDELKHNNKDRENYSPEEGDVQGIHNVSIKKDLYETVNNVDEDFVSNYKTINAQLIRLSNITRSVKYDIGIMNKNIISLLIDKDNIVYEIDKFSSDEYVLLLTVDVVTFIHSRNKISNDIYILDNSVKSILRRAVTVYVNFISNNPNVDNFIDMKCIHDILKGVDRCDKVYKGYCDLTDKLREALNKNESDMAKNPDSPVYVNNIRAKIREILSIKKDIMVQKININDRIYNLLLLLDNVLTINSSVLSLLQDNNNKLRRILRN